MKRSRLGLTLLFACAFIPPLPAQEKSPRAPSDRVDFYGEVKPLLAIHCAKCHGAEKPKAGLRLDRRDGLLKGGESGEAAVVPGKSAGSVLIRRVGSKDPEERMPPKGEPLAAAQVETLRRWVDQGAPWPDKDDYWAFKPPERPAVPGVKEAGVPNPIDAFVQAKLESRGLRPAPPAEKVALLRRLTADLVGMPPAPEEADAFLADGSPDAVEKLVDRLLADPRYGERWARHWLDLVRYGESDGYENDKVRPHAWRYRDYVIRSLNDDKPYDRFIREQIAGDELAPGDPEAIVATGFARLSPWDPLCKNEKQRWQDFLNDATDTTGSVFLGMTLGCSRCHDHKYDRITMTDYYSLQSFFAEARRENKPLPDGGNDPGHFRREVERAEAAVKSLRAEKQELRDRNALRVVLEKSQAGEPDEKLSPTDEEIRKSVDKHDKARASAVEKEIKLQESVADLYRPTAEVILETGAKAAPTHLLKRGNLATPGPEVKPAFIAALAGDRPEASVAPALGGKSTGRRSALAEWLASPSNPMTARVIVNRLWQHHFGAGIVATPSDFGRNGRKPTHPELLDWLACELVANGWRLKPIHRLMLTSATYRRSTAFDAESAKADPENRLLWRMNRLRLEGEALRDSILAVSGRLNPKRGGPGVYPRISKEINTELPTNDQPPCWGTATEEEGCRRTIYVFQRRALMYPLVEAYDGAEMSHTCPKRPVTTVAPQALSLFNGEFARGEARFLAERAARDSGGDRGRQVERAYRLALVRPPSEEDRKEALRFLDGQARRRLPPGEADARARAEAERMALVDFCHVLFNSNEFVYLD